MSNRTNFNQLLQRSATIDDALAAFTKNVPGTKPRNVFSENPLVEFANGILQSGDSITSDNFHKIVELDKKLVQVSPEISQKLYVFCINMLLPDNQTQDTSLKQKALGLVCKYTFYEKMIYKINQFMSRFMNRDQAIDEASFSKQSVALQYLDLFEAKDLTTDIITYCIQIGARNDFPHQDLLENIRGSKVDRVRIIESLLRSPVGDEGITDTVKLMSLIAPEELTVSNIHDLTRQLSRIDLRNNVFQALKMIPKSYRGLDNIKKLIEIFSRLKPQDKEGFLKDLQKNPEHYLDATNRQST